MQRLYQMAWWREMAANLLLAYLFSISARDLWHAFNDNPRASIGLYFVMIAFITVLFLIRKTPSAVSFKPVDWIIAFLGTCFALQIEPTANPDYPPAVLLEILGIILSIAGLVSIGRSFAIVPALRELKTDYIYRYIRHPIYAGYILTFIGLLMNHVSTHNAVAISISMLLIIVRIQLEERFLVLHAPYKKYMKHTPWRLVPYVW
jgi:protein-S-isoprenylcysteine O-methyltransferase Ste14